MKTKEIAQNLKKISEIQFFWKNNLLRKLVPPAKISTIKVLKISEKIRIHKKFVFTISSVFLGL